MSGTRGRFKYTGGRAAQHAARLDHSLDYLARLSTAYVPGIQCTSGCKLEKMCCRWSVVPGPERMILVVFFAPEHSWWGDGVGLADAVGVAVFGVLFVAVVLH